MNHSAEDWDNLSVACIDALLHLRAETLRITQKSGFPPVHEVVDAGIAALISSREEVERIRSFAAKSLCHEALLPMRQFGPMLTILAGEDSRGISAWWPYYRRLCRVVDQYKRDTAIRVIEGTLSAREMFHVRMAILICMGMLALCPILYRLRYPGIDSIGEELLARLALHLISPELGVVPLTQASNHNPGRVRSLVR